MTDGFVFPFSHTNKDPIPATYYFVVPHGCCPVLKLSRVLRLKQPPCAPSDLYECTTEGGQ